MPSAIIAIVGRPNVGKSTLFNRILGAREAIVHDMPGVTRDRKYAETEWAGTHFTIIDTGGYVPDSEDVFERAIREQASIAIEEADVVVFVVDAQAGITPLDQEITNILRKSKKPICLAVNKIDSAKREIDAAEFYALGLGEPISISALAGRQIGDFLDIITSLLKAAPEEEGEQERLRIAVIGKPNVGKSSLVNALLGKSRQVVTEIPGTTRDPIDSILKYGGEEFVLVDTAGLRKRRRLTESVEFYSAMRTLRSIERCDVALILFDAGRGFDVQDLHIVESTMERRRSAIIAVNKWDLVEKETDTAREYETFLKGKLGIHDHIPIVFVSALTKQRIHKLVDRAKLLHAEQCKRIETSELNDVLLPEIDRNPPKSSSPKEIKIKYITQVKTQPPMFAFFCKEPKLIQESYKRYLANRIRDCFGFAGVPFTLTFKKK
ncbi:MAG: ribosome biogenesis GTPase Der [Ignavibacteriales bacterium]|nr:ribosome biogenesis GTPase Der [Ignavibacteriales bacterium]